MGEQPYDVNLVTTLRAYAGDADEHPAHAGDLGAAADEIERLGAEVARLTHLSGEFRRLLEMAITKIGAKLREAVDERASARAEARRLEADRDALVEAVRVVHREAGEDWRGRIGPSSTSLRDLFAAAGLFAAGEGES